jgi:uncharacterized protein (TIGR02172 family)
MDIQSTRNSDTLVLALSGKLDSTTAAALGRALQLEGVRSLLLDLGQCPYVSSAGLREILMANKRMLAAGGQLTLVDVTRDVQQVLDLTGFSRLLTVRPKAREISIEGLEFLSAGVCGECYRLDSETVVKLYNEGVEPAIAEKEKEFARAAFIAGIPTAISYDVVACGKRTGIVYEMLDAKLFSAIIRADLDQIDGHARLLAQIAANIHATPADAALLPDIKQSFRTYIRQMDFFLSAEQIAFLLDQLEALPDADTCVHFDIHTSNIMIRDGEPVIIDMGDLSRGSYLFDLGLLETIYGFPELGTCEMVTKIPSDKGAELLQRFLVHYFADKPPQAFEFFQRHRDFLASLRPIYTITFLPKLRDELVVMVRDVLLPRMMARHQAG